MSRAEIMEMLGLRDRNSFSENYLIPALTNELIEMTQPDSPNSPTQKYRLTEKGKQMLMNKDKKN
jgi:ATP-dependent DNA helicase RecG